MVVDGKLSASMAKAQLKTLCLPVDAINLTIDLAIIPHAIKTGTLDVCGLNGFHQLIYRQNLSGLRYPDFSIYCRINLTCEK